jgi:hypothetical protein
MNSQFYCSFCYKVYTYDPTLPQVFFVCDGCQNEIGTPNSTPGSPPSSATCQILGGISTILGAVILFAFLFLFDTSVESGYGRVHNIGLISLQQNAIIFGGILLIVGILLILFRKR